MIIDQRDLFLSGFCVLCMIKKNFIFLSKMDYVPSSTVINSNVNKILPRVLYFFKVKILLTDF